MKKVLLTLTGLSIVFSVAVLSCKKDDNATPSTTTTSGTTTSTTSGTTTSTTSGTTTSTTSVTPPCTPTSNTLTLGSTYTFNSFNGMNNSGHYQIAAMTNGNYPMMNYTFGTGTVTSGIYNITVWPTAATDVAVQFATGSSALSNASTGQVYVNVSGSSITCTICGVTFSGSAGAGSATSKITKP